MIRFFFRTVKWLVVVGGVLWLGQTRLGDSTVGAEFRRWTTRLWRGELKQQVRSEVRARLEKPIEWLKEERPKLTRLYPKTGVAFDEKISDSDREALRRLLEQDKEDK